MLMNSLLKIKDLNFAAIFNRKLADQAFFTGFVFVSCCVIYSPLAFANRPAMTEEGDMPAAVEENIPESPSSVEIMMQQQTRQTGDVLQLPAKEMQPGETVKIQLLNTPRRGMSMEKVQQTFGQPLAVSDSVGKPPITRWTYSDRIVYFEYSTVIHVVAR